MPKPKTSWSSTATSWSWSRTSCSSAKRSTARRSTGCLAGCQSRSGRTPTEQQNLLWLRVSLVPGRIDSGSGALGLGRWAGQDRGRGRGRERERGGLGWLFLVLRGARGGSERPQDFGKAVGFGFVAFEVGIFLAVAVADGAGFEEILVFGEEFDRGGVGFGGLDGGAQDFLRPAAAIDGHQFHGRSKARFVGGGAGHHVGEAGLAPSMK